MRRVVVPLASLALMVSSFVAATWAVRTWSGDEAPRAAIPGLARSTPQTPSEATRPPVAAGSTIEADASPDPMDSAARLAAAADAAEEAARAELISAAGSPGESLPVRVDLYLESLTRSLEASGDGDMLVHRGVWTEHFLRIDGVQAQLAELGPTARASALAEIRRRMGYEEEAVARMAERDAERDARWSRGLAYLEQRDRLQATFEGEVLDEELRHLRERTFAHEATTIEREEASGFERFERPRIYGRN